MTSFVSKKLSSINTLGEKLQSYRNEKNWTREQAAKILNINVRYIKELEADDFEHLPADVYTINILKSYADILELNPITAVNLYKRQKALYLGTRKKKYDRSGSLLNRTLNLFLNPKLIKYTIGSIFLVSVLLYIGWQVNKIIEPPKLVIDSPDDNMIINSREIEISGTTDKEVNLTINNRLLLSDKSGHFSLKIDLQKGLNIIKISSQKKHSKEQVIYRRIIVTEEETDDSDS
ncbi:helix-turn-helix domain-containing protein [Patescibacteria group bacterium]|nr:helix-turn-helix domain-containing protein [Patescibacteria group bacterium]